MLPSILAHAIILLGLAMSARKFDGPIFKWLLTAYLIYLALIVVVASEWHIVSIAVLLMLVILMIFVLRSQILLGQFLFLFAFAVTRVLIVKIF